MNDLVDLLLPYMNDSRERQALIQAALYGCRALDLIDWSGNADTFTKALVFALLKFGKCSDNNYAIIKLLYEVKKNLGVEKSQYIDLLIEKYKQPVEPHFILFETSIPNPPSNYASPPRPTPHTVADKSQTLEGLAFKFGALAVFVIISFAMHPLAGLITILVGGYLLFR